MVENLAYGEQVSLPPLNLNNPHRPCAGGGKVWQLEALPFLRYQSLNNCSVLSLDTFQAQPAQKAGKT
jgi:hypothetical protein